MSDPSINCICIRICVISEHIPQRRRSPHCKSFYDILPFQCRDLQCSFSTLFRVGFAVSRRIPQGFRFQHWSDCGASRGIHVWPGLWNCVFWVSSSLTLLYCSRTFLAVMSEVHVHAVFLRLYWSQRPHGLTFTWWGRCGSKT